MAEPASKSRMVLAEETMAEPASKSRMVLAEETMAEPASKSRMVLAEETMAEPASKSRMVLAEEGCSYFPEEILDCIFKSLNGHRRTFKSLSVVSKQFLAITNRLRSSVKITDQTIPYLDRLFQRFPNLTSLKITIQSKTIEELDDILTLISTFPLHKVKSLNLSTRPIHIHSNGLIALAKTMKNLKFLTCYKMVNVEKNDLFFIAGCFPLLEELNLSYPRFRCSRDFELQASASRHTQETEYRHTWKSQI
ncbi:uncharacterized protein LOC131606145 [Vicia villosa]|uniref:uncharacterized protein LOC131606145 n=1 Tax=Vicia villosa TaxID=3911 RepID=UPI00273B7096|nr:uncharacterized protein LOC131606145 [Vicia villosa]